MKPEVKNDASAKKPKKPIYKNMKVMILIIALVFVIIIASVLFYFNSIPKAHTDDISLQISIKDDQQIFDNGTKIILSIKLKNVAGHPIKIRAPIKHYIDVHVIHNGDEYREIKPEIDYDGPYWEILWNSDPIEYERTLGYIDFEGPNGARDRNIFESPGEFEIYCTMRWTSGGMNKESDHITIEVIE